MKLILILADMKTSKIITFGAQKTRRNQNESLLRADFDPEA